LAEIQKAGFLSNKRPARINSLVLDEKRRVLSPEIWSGRAESNRRLILGKVCGPF
jgi:hypothetical protein